MIKRISLLFIWIRVIVRKLRKAIRAAAKKRRVANPLTISGGGTPLKLLHVFVLSEEKRRDDDKKLESRCWSNEKTEDVPH
jgi:6-phosphogluconolactonase/glucosamine-6-phosphate isomerase/deaminase